MGTYGGAVGAHKSLCRSWDSLLPDNAVAHNFLLPFGRLQQVCYLRPNQSSRWNAPAKLRSLHPNAGTIPRVVDIATFCLMSPSSSSTPIRTSPFKSSMPTIAGRTRPIEKFATAASRCSVEVHSYRSMRQGRTDALQGDGVWQVHIGRLPVSSPRHVCKGVCKAEGLLSCMTYIISHLSSV